MKKTLSIILSLIMALSAFSVMPFSAFALNGEGTAENPYKIGTAAELKEFRDLVNGGAYGACAVLTADIDLGNEAWTPIGSNSKKYIGTFDGQSYTISGLKVDISSSENVYAGLFGYVGNWQSGGTVKCVYVNGSVSAVSTTSGAYAGGVVGLNYTGTICNCTFTGAVSAKGRDANVVAAGGIVGENFDKVDGCLHVGGNVSATADATSASAGGVVGANVFGSMRCSAHTGGTVTATVTGDGEACAGGVAGESYNNANIQYCFSTGSTVTATHTDTSRANVGGVVGRNVSTLSNCYYDSDKATDVTAVGTDTGTTTNVSGLTSTQFKNAASFLGWDFDTVWYMGADCPQLWALSSHVSTWTELTAALNKGDGIVLTADVTPENPYWANALVVPSGVTANLDLNGHVIDRGYTEQGFDGSVIKVNGKLTVTDSSTEMTGAITGGWPEQYGGGVYIDGGTFNLQGGSITGNSVGKNGFGAMEGVGGGVYLQSGSFNMSGGKITGNKAANSNPMAGGKQGKGGGVYVNSGTFTLTGGTITGNEAGKLGGGVYIASTYSSSDGKINVSGNPSVTGNFLNGTENNVYIEDGGDFIVTDELTGVIGVTMQTPGIFTTRLYGNGTIANFTSDNADYHVEETGGEAQLAEHNWNTEWSKDRTNHWHACERCTAKKDEASHSYGDWEPVDDTNHSHSCGECGAKGTEAHTFGVATYTWNGLTSVTAKHTCSTCNKEVTETANATSQVTTPATCTGKEITTYTATFTKAGFTTQTKEVETSDALDHLWAAPTYVWSADNKTVTATRICTRDASHTENEIGNATYKITKPATCTEQGEITYTATFTNTAFETQTRKVDTPPNDHSWKTEWSKDGTNHWHDCNNCTEKKDEAPHNYGEVSYEWSGTASVKATRVCADCDYEDTETVNTTSEQTRAPACTVKGETTYTATFTNTAFETQTKTVDDIDALEHDYTSTVTAPTCTEKGYSTYTCSRGDDEYIDDYVDALGHTYGTTGDERFTCTRCGYVDEEKKTAAEAEDKAAADEAAAKAKAEKEEAKAEFVAGVKGTSDENKVTVKWGKVKGAQRYVIYATYCSKKNKYKKIATVKGDITKYDITKLNGKKLNPKKNVKVYVVAQKKVKGKYKKIFKTPTFHIAGAKSKYSNVKKITVKKNKYTLKVGKTAKIKAKIVLGKKNKKAIAHVKKFRYKSTNTAVVKVDKNGKIKAIGKGKATVYVYSNNGTAKAIRITVK